MRPPRALVVGGAVLVGLTACSSGEGELESRLRSEPALLSNIVPGPYAGVAVHADVACAARALRKDAEPGDLDLYVADKLPLAMVRAKHGAPNAVVTSDVATCADQAISVATGPPAH